jgi:GcrA cell cycle regulator
MSWTDERIQELTRLWQEGHSASEIGRRLGVSKNAVVGKAHRLKLPSRPSPIKQQNAAASAEASAPAATASASGNAPAANGAAASASASADSVKPAPKKAAAKANDARAQSDRLHKTAKAGGKSAANGNGVRRGGMVSSSTPSTARAQVEARGGRSGCLWPIGDPNDPEFHFCGADALPGKPYCAEHAARAYITRSPRSDREDTRDEEAA